MKAFFKRFWLRLVIIASAVALTLTLLLTVFLAGSISVELNDKTLSIKAYYLSSSHFASTYIEDLTLYSVSITSGFTDGTSTEMGVERIKIKAGRFKNATLKEYMLFRYNKVKSVIILRKNEGDYSVAFNCKTEKETRKLYDDISAIIN